MLPGVNIINWTKGRWGSGQWDDVGRKIDRAWSAGLRVFRVWLHFDYANTARDADGALHMAPGALAALRERVPTWPGEIVFEWSWGYYGDGLAEHWADDLIAGRFAPLAAEWRALLNELDDPRLSLSVGNEMDGLRQKSGVAVGALGDALAQLERPFTCGWCNEHSFDGPLAAAAAPHIMRFSYYEANESRAAKRGSLASSAAVRSGNWGVAEFGLSPHDDLDDAIARMKAQVARFAAAGARDVLLWAVGAGDKYAWQLDSPRYVEAFVRACRAVE